MRAPGDQDDLPRRVDVVFVGAGHNALVAAAYLAGAGRSVCLLERMSHPGGWVQTAELGAPGFRHDRYSALHSAFIGGLSWAELAPERPIPAHAGGHGTAVPAPWLIGAATWPGPGVNGASGCAVARALMGTASITNSRATAKLSH